jgi:hypothetical protein
MMTTDIKPSLEMLINEFFRSVSFQTGETPAYCRIHELFVEEGKLIKNNSNAPEMSTIDGFIASRQRMVDSGVLTSFLEIETAEITEVFGNIAHRFSTYVKRSTVNGAVIEGRGLISTQFIRTPAGWRMISMAWDDERPGLTIPARYQ